MDILNDLNYHKYGKLLVETCTRTMLIVYQYLYDWPDKCAHKLIDHLDEIPVYQTKSLKLLFKAEIDISKLRAMMANKEKMEGFDITFYFKLIQFATNNRSIKRANDDVWNRNCPVNLKNELEHLLFLVKSDRNDFNHKDDKFLNLKDDDIKIFCDTLRQRLPSIIQQAGTKAGRNHIEIDETCDNLIEEIDGIQAKKEISSSDGFPILKIMVEDDLIPGLNDLRRCFSEELKGYCPPDFKLENKTIITTEELLSKDDSQVICITAQAGFGKTSFTKYIQFELLSKIENAGDDLASLEIPIRIACRNITGRNVSEFLEDELPISRHYASNTSSLKNFLERFNICWIIDGYDERTAEFSGFFQSLLKTLTINHKIIITSRPNCMTEIKDQLKNKKVCDVVIECFSDQQIKEVTKKYIVEDKVIDFESTIKTVSHKTLELMKMPLNLIMCLEFWSKDPTDFYGNVTSTHQLYDKINDRHIDLLVSRHIGKTAEITEKELKISVMMWFKYLCEIVAESAFSYKLKISESQTVKLMQKAKTYGLLGAYCLSTFLNFKKSFRGEKYSLKHKIQKEVLVCIYLKKCNDDALKVVAQQDGITYLLKRHNPYIHFKFLVECCNECEFAKIFVRFLDLYPAIQCPDCLLEIKDGKEFYFNSLKKEIQDSKQPLVLHVYKDSEVVDLLKVLQYLMPDITSFKLVICYTSNMTKNIEINDFINKYKDRNYFHLKLEFVKQKPFLPTTKMIEEKGNNNLIKELDYNSLETCSRSWYRTFQYYILRFENLEKLSIRVDCNENNSSVLFYFATSKHKAFRLPSFSSHLNSSQRPSRKKKTVPVATVRSWYVLFDIVNMKDPSKVISDVLKVSTKFQSISINLPINNCLTGDLDCNLLQRFLSSSIQLKELRINYRDFSKYPNVMKLINYDHIEILFMGSQYDDVSQSMSDFKYFLNICDFDKLKKLTELFLSSTMDKSLLNLIYNQLPSELLNKTTLCIRHYKYNEAMERIFVDSNNKKQFRRIRVYKS